MPSVERTQIPKTKNTNGKLPNAEKPDALKRRAQFRIIVQITFCFDLCCFLPVYQLSFLQITAVVFFSPALENDVILFGLADDF